MSDDKKKKDENDRMMGAILDGYGNVVTGLGGVGDKSSYTWMAPNRWIGAEELGRIYEQDALAARIVDRIVDDATRTRYRIVGTDENVDWASVESELDDLETIQHMGDAWRWSRLYGGSLVVMAIDDGRPASEPVDWQNVRKLKHLDVVSSPSVTVPGFVGGVGSKAIRDPEYYEIIVTGEGKDRLPSTVHRSRVVRWDGLRLPAERLSSGNGQHNGWGVGIIQRVWEDIRALGSAYKSAENILHEMSVLTLKITGFQEMLCGGPENQEKAKQMLQNLKWSIDNLHMLGLDAQDDLKEITRDTGGVDKVIDKFRDRALSATEYPRTVLFGEAPGGLNAAASGNTEMDAYYDAVAAEQEGRLAPRVSRVLEVIFAARRNRGETVPREWTIEFDPLVQEDNKNQAENSAKWADTATKLVTAGIATPQEMRAKMIQLGYFEAAGGPAPDKGEVAEIPEEFASPMTKVPQTPGQDD